MGSEIYRGFMLSSSYAAIAFYFRQKKLLRSMQQLKFLLDWSIEGKLPN